MNVAQTPDTITIDPAQVGAIAQTIRACVDQSLANRNYSLIASSPAAQDQYDRELWATWEEIVTRALRAPAQAAALDFDGLERLTEQAEAAARRN